MLDFGAGRVLETKPKSLVYRWGNRWSCEHLKSWVTLTTLLMGHPVHDKETEMQTVTFPKWLGRLKQSWVLTSSFPAHDLALSPQVQTPLTEEPQELVLNHLDHLWPWLWPRLLKDCFQRPPCSESLSPLHSQPTPLPCPLWVMTCENPEYLHHLLRDNSELRAE